MKMSPIIFENATANQTFCTIFLKRLPLKQIKRWGINTCTLLPLFLLLLLSGATNAQPGQPDPTFGVNGVVKVPFVKTGTFTSFQGASFSIEYVPSYSNPTVRVFKYASNGLPDQSFGTNGVSQPVTLTYFGSVVEEDGRIVVVGSVGLPFGPIHDQIRTIRFNDYGMIDDDFTTREGFTYRFPTKVVNIAGKAAVFGYGISLVAGVNYDFVISGHSEKTISPNRTNDNTSLAPFSVSKTLAIQENKIIVAGLESFSQPTPHTGNFLAKYSNGLPDPSFGVNGFTTQTPPLARYQNMVLPKSGKIYLAYSWLNQLTGNADFAIEKLNENGSPDLTYGNNGVLLVDLGGNDGVSSIISYNDKFIVGGTVINRTSGQVSFGFAFFNENGTLATNFGTQGKQVVGQNGYSFPLTYMNVKNDRLYAYGNGNSTDYQNIGITAALLLQDVNRILCPVDKVVTVDYGVSSAIVTNMDPFTSPIGTVSYTLTGATNISGIGTANTSNIRFNIGVTTVTYSLIADPTKTCSFTVTVLNRPNELNYYSKAIGDLHNLQTWGTNRDGSGINPTDFGIGKVFHLQNRGVVTCPQETAPYIMTGDWTVDGIIVLANNTGLDLNGFTLSERGIVTDFITYDCGREAYLKTDRWSSLIVKGGYNGANVVHMYRYFSNNRVDLKNLAIDSDGSAEILNRIDLYGVLTLKKGVLIGPYPNDPQYVPLTFKSNAEGTARVAPVSASSQVRVSVERYIPPRRAWRLLSAPVKGSDFGIGSGNYFPYQTIKNSWQEGALSTTNNPSPGFGTHITGGTAANGFDLNPAGFTASILRYASATNSWLPLANTNNTRVAADAYMVFVRGDRSIPLSYNNVTPTPTVLRSTGYLKEGPQTFTVAASGFTAIPNPFASPINFATITRNNVQNNFYLWDPKLGGQYGVGAYVLISSNGAGGYNITPARASPESQYIQSGQGFMVQSTGVAGSIIIKESDKYAGPAANVFRSSKILQGLRVTLQSTNNDNSTSILDEVLTSYGTQYSNHLDELDAIKPANFNENLGLSRDGKILMLERRNMNLSADTVFLKLWNMEQKEYILHLTPENLAGTSIQSATLVDHYLKTSVAIDLKEASIIKFSVDGNGASANPQRFMIVIRSTKENAEIVSIRPGFKISPNPLTGMVLKIEFINQPKGTYYIGLVNSLGQTIVKDLFKHPGGSIILPFKLKSTMSKGVYHVSINNATNNFKTQVVLPGN